MAVKVLQLHKRASYEYKFVQDKYAYSEQAKCYAVADGTTQSFNSEFWAELITKRFIEKPVFETSKLIEELDGCAKKFKERKYEFSSNPAKASLEKEKLKKGATATLIGAKIDNNSQLSIISCGDSNVFIIRENEFLSFPFKTIEELDSSRYFLNTEKILSNEIEVSFFLEHTIQLKSNDVIILATDALSRLILKSPDSHKDLLLINNFDSFHEFCLNHWNKKILEEDDITAIIIQDFHSNTSREILPPLDFQFPKEPEIEFIPASLATHSTPINDVERQQLLATINRINQELTEIRKKSKFQEMLLMLAISLIAVNLLLPFYVNPKQSEQNLEKNTTKQSPGKQYVKPDKEMIDLKKQVKVLQKEKDSLIQTVSTLSKTEHSNGKQSASQNSKPK